MLKEKAVQDHDAQVKRRKIEAYGANESLTKRIENEKQIYNKGLDREREKYNSRFGHAQSGCAFERQNSMFRKILQKGFGANVLELGSTNWKDYVDFKNYAPAHLTCINLSERELEKGIILAREGNTNQYCEHDFLVMDAHKLSFPDNTFDLIFGGGILHHLDFDVAIKEIYRVCKPGGEICFLEPLARNPVGKIVRKLTPNARTPDEKPLDKEEFSCLSKYFKMDNSFFQLFYVPAGFISKFIFKTPNNILMRGADKLDCAIEKTFRNISVGLYYRRVLIHGYSQKRC